MAKILIVDDDDLNRKLFRTILEAEKYNVFEADNGIEGIETAEKIIPDVILLDIQMPGIDGVKACGILKSGHITGNIPVIALTSYAMDGDKEKFLLAGFDGYISKPINIADFVSVIKNHIEKKGAVCLKEP